MNISEIISNNPQINLTISGSELQYFAETLIRKGLQQDIHRNQKLYTAKEAQKILRVSAPTLWRKEKAGLFRPTLIGGKKMYTQSEIDRILKGGQNNE